MTVIDADGVASAARVYEFGARRSAAVQVAEASVLQLGGRFVEADGSPAIELPVAIYPIKPGASGQIVPLARTVTGSDGQWRAEMSSLPPEIQALADDNDGVLNLQGVAEGVTLDPLSAAARAMSGLAVFSTGVPVNGVMSPAAQEASMSATPTAPLLPVRRSEELTPAPPADTPGPPDDTNSLSAEDREFATADLFSFRNVDGSQDESSDPRRIGGVDYTNRPVTAPGSGMGPDHPDDQCYIENALVTSRVRETFQYTDVIEGHAYQDAIAGVAYSTTANSELTYGISYNAGSSWGAHGSVRLNHSVGWGSGYVRGPYFSYEWKVPVRYVLFNIYMCTMEGGIKKLKYRYSASVAERVVPPNGGAVGAYGANVSAYDGWYGYRDAPYKGIVPRGSFFYITRDKTISYGAGANAFGFSVTSTTSKADSRLQRIQAGLQPVNHYIFGYSPMQPSMKVFYSY